MGSVTALKVQAGHLILGPSVRLDVERGLDELCRSIRVHGLVTPLKVVRIRSMPDAYQVFDGERRLRAIRRLEANGELPDFLVEVEVIGARDKPVKSVREAMDAGLFPKPAQP